MKKEERYPELINAVKEISRYVILIINDKAMRTESEMPYKAQFILEELIKLLQEKV